MDLNKYYAKEAFKTYQAKVKLDPLKFKSEEDLFHDDLLQNSPLIHRLPCHYLMSKVAPVSVPQEGGNSSSSVDGVSSCGSFVPWVVEEKSEVLQTLLRKWYYDPLDQVEHSLAVRSLNGTLTAGPAGARLEYFGCARFPRDTVLS